MVLHPIGCDRSGTADVEDPDLTALKEVMSPEVFPAIDPFFDGNMFFHRHAAQCHHAVYMRVDRYHLVRAVEILDQELISQFFCCVAFYISLICGIANMILWSEVRSYLRRQTYRKHRNS